jgi:formate dehydrogenase major subunit/NADH-quinone oxidoreductase subunit G
MSSTVRITIDGKPVEVAAGEKILWAALDNGIYIPHLCSIRENHSPFASCRLCFVEIAGRPRPVTACTEGAAGGMVVSTRSERVDRLVRTGFEMIISNQRHSSCKGCPRNRKCGLQKIARERGLSLKLSRLQPIDRNLSIDDTAERITYDPNKCVLCGQCVWTCRNVGAGILGFARRGIERMVTTFGEAPLGESGCRGCAACAATCPVGAITEKA